MNNYNGRNKRKFEGGFEKEKKRKISISDRLGAWKEKLKSEDVQKSIEKFKKKKQKRPEIRVEKAFSSSEQFKPKKFTFFEEDKRKERKIQEVEENVDPLEQFFHKVDKKLNNLQKMDNLAQQTTISLSDISKTEKQEGIENNKEDEDFHANFVNAFKKQTRKKDVFFEDESDFIQEGAQEVEDVVYKQKTLKKDLKIVDHSKIQYEPFRKNLYIPSPDIVNMSLEEVEVLRRSYGEFILKGKNIPRPIQYWRQCGLDSITLKTLKKMGYTKPFAIQAQAIPCLMSGRDVIGIAPTGSGKTLAFVLPMIRHILDQRELKEGDGPIGLIICNTRELATQIFKEVIKLFKPLKLRVCCCYGGGSMSTQISQLKYGAHCIVCTPGRMIDLLCANRGRVTNLQRVTYVVLDEADRMFDFGFGPQITRIVGNIRPTRQLAFFSATFPKPLEALARKILKNCIEIIVGGRSVANKKIQQFVEVHNESSKFLRILELLGIWYGKGNILIFVKSRENTGLLFKDLYASGYDALVLHSGMDQLDRNETLKAFKKREKTILIGTALLSRGIDVKEIEIVINYDVPNHYEDYVHQVGRTGRGEKSGTAYTFVKPNEDEKSPDLVKALKLSGNMIPDPLLKMYEGYMEKKKKKLVREKHILHGFTGTGFQFDEEEAFQQNEDIQRQMKYMGFDDEGNEIEENFVATKKEDFSGKERAKIVSKITQKEKKNKNVSGVSQAIAFAKTLTIKANLAPVTSKTKPTLHSEEIEINDYPQKARWKVTRSNSEDLYRITEEHNCTVTTKGKYVRPGEELPFGERKLFLLIEGRNEEDVENCKLKLYKLMEEASQSRIDPRIAKLGRYTIL